MEELPQGAATATFWVSRTTLRKTAGLNGRQRGGFAAACLAPSPFPSWNLRCCSSEHIGIRGQPNATSLNPLPAERRRGRRGRRQVSTISTKSDEVNDVLSSRRENIEELNGVRALLKKLQVGCDDSNVDDNSS